MPREAILMHGTAEAFEKLNETMGAQMRPLAEKQRGFLIWGVAPDPERGPITTGTKLTLTAEARPGWTFVGWANGTGSSPLQEGDILSTKAKWQIVVTNDAEYCAFFESKAYISGVTAPSDGGRVIGSGYCPAGNRVTPRATKWRRSIRPTGRTIRGSR